MLCFGGQCCGVLGFVSSGVCVRVWARCACAYCVYRGYGRGWVGVPLAIVKVGGVWWGGLLGKKI